MIELIQSSWLQQHLTDPEVVIVDPRPVVKYLEGHIPHAVNLPLAKLLDPESMALRPLDQLAKTIGEAGIGHNRTAVLYDGYDGQNAAMVAWTLVYVGHPRVNILSSRLEGWTSEGGEILYKPVTSRPTTFGVNPDNAVRAVAEEVRKRGNIKLLDMRSREEYQGKVATEIRTGRIPGATNIPWTDLIGSRQTFLRPKLELETVFRKIGLVPADEIVTYCTYGPRAAIGFLALQHLRYDNVRVYDGSFHQWGQNLELPVEGEGLQIEL